MYEKFIVMCLYVLYGLVLKVKHFPGGSESALPPQKSKYKIKNTLIIKN